MYSFLKNLNIYFILFYQGRKQIFLEIDNSYTWIIRYTLELLFKIIIFENRHRIRN